MPLLSFSVFKDKILSGAKRHTIRAPRKIPIKVGDKLYMWWKSRSPKEKEKLGETKCISTNPIEIDDDCVHILDTSNFYNTTTYSSKEALDRFAVSDGFDNWQHLIEFFKTTHGLPFKGDLIEWDGIVKDVDPELAKALNEWSDLVEDTCPCGQMGVLDCAGECGYGYSDEDCHECGGTGHHFESIHMPCSNCLGNGKQPH